MDEESRTPRSQEWSPQVAYARVRVKNSPGETLVAQSVDARTPEPEPDPGTVWMVGVNIYRKENNLLSHLPLLIFAPWGVWMEW
jgi:hypothetical protein